MCTEERTELWDRVGSSEVDSEVEGWDEEWEEWTICVQRMGKKRRSKCRDYWGTVQLKSRGNILLHGKFVEK